MSQDGKSSSKTILVVDDEPDICDALKLALGMVGFTVKAALDRDEALRICAKEPLAAVLFDYRMPGLDAAQFVAQLRSQCAGTPVILMTAGKDPDGTARQLGLRHALA